MKRVEVKKTFKEILDDISLPDKLVSIGVICIMIFILMLLTAVIIATFSKYGVICGLFVTLVSVGVYSILTGLCISGIGDIVNIYKVEYIEDDK